MILEKLREEVITLILSYSKVFRVARPYARILSYAIYGAAAIGFLSSLLFILCELLSSSIDLEGSSLLSSTVNLMSSENVISSVKTRGIDDHSPFSPIIWIGAYIGFFWGWGIGWNKHKMKIYVRLYRG
jgi:hypothetical protein